jgi:hypothetical protein
MRAATVQLVTAHLTSTVTVTFSLTLDQPVTVTLSFMRDVRGRQITAGSLVASASRS